MTNIEIRVRDMYDGLSNAEKKAAAYFLQNLSSIFGTPISALAAESGVSQVAWVRFCKSMGFLGLKDLKRSLFQELQTSADTPEESERYYADIRNMQSVSEMAQTVKNSSIQAIEDTMKLVSSRDIEAAAAQIIGAKSVGLFGLGASALVAEDLHHKLLRIGKDARFCRDNHIQLTYAANLGPHDVAVLFSNSGLTKEMLEILALCKRNGCKTVAVTRYGKSPLATGCDRCLFISSPEVNRRSGAMSSRIAQLVVVDLLFTTVAGQDYAQIQKPLENSYQSCKAHRVKEI